MAEHHHDPAHHHDPVAHHTERAASATGLKKKLGPLPVWAWVAIIGGAALVYYFMHSSSSSSGTPTADTVDPNNALGLTYAQEQQDMEEGIDPNTGESYASEQSAADSLASGGGTTDASGTDDSAELTAIDSDLQTLQSDFAYGLDDGTTPEQTFAGELEDVGAGITALQGLQATLSPTPTTASGTASSANSTAALVKTANKVDTAAANSAAASIEAEQAAVAKAQAKTSTAAAKAAAASPKKAASGGLIGTVKVSGKKK